MIQIGIRFSLQYVEKKHTHPWHSRLGKVMSIARTMPRNKQVDLFFSALLIIRGFPRYTKLIAE
jgi:hypothetical protein